jgi:hypothetical protein
MEKLIVIRCYGVVYDPQLDFSKAMVRVLTNHS